MGMILTSVKNKPTRLSWQNCKCIFVQGFPVWYLCWFVSIANLFASVVLSQVCFVSDYVAGGELFTHLYQREHFTENEVRIYIGEIILALEHLHSVSTVYFVIFEK